MPRARKTAKQMLEEADGIDSVGGRTTSRDFEREEARKKRQEIKDSAKSNRKYTILYIVFALLFLVLAFVIIGLMNLAIYGQFTIF